MDEQNVAVEEALSEQEIAKETKVQPGGDNLPLHWLKVDLGDLLEQGKLTITNGFAQGGYNESGQGVPHLRPFNVTEDGFIDLSQIKSVEPPRETSPYWVHPGDVIFNNTNSEELVGKTAYFALSGKFVLSNHMTLIRILDSQTLDALWFANEFQYLWRRRVFQALCRRHVNQASISLERLKGIIIPLPPFFEQRTIAHALRTVQEAIQTRRREADLERERKAALMQHLFTYGTRGEPTKQTEIGEKPESWRVVPLGQVAKITSGGTPDRTKPEYWNGDIPWVKTGEIDYKIITTAEEYITRAGLANSSAKITPAGTLLMAMYGQGVTRGRVAILGIDAALNQACAAITLMGGMVTDFVFYFLTHNYESIRNLGHGANQKNLNALLIKAILVACPHSNEQQEIATTLRACDNKITALEQEIKLLEELFRALLEELMTGQLSVAPLVVAHE